MLKKKKKKKAKFRRFSIEDTVLKKGAPFIQKKKQNSPKSATFIAAVVRFPLFLSPPPPPLPPPLRILVSLEGATLQA